MGEPRKRRPLRLLLKILVVLLVLVGLAPLALGLGFVRDFLARKASVALGAPVTLGGASGWWTSGITLTDVVVGSPPGHDGPLARVETLHVKVGLGGLFSGDVDAAVTVTKPLVTLRRNPQKRWNTEDLGAAKDRHGPEKPPREGKESPGPRIALEVIDGVVEAHGVSTQVERIRDIDLSAQLDPDGALSAALGLLAERAGLDGKDARITFEGSRQPGQPSPIEAQVPTLDLARLAGLIEGATGLTGIAGTTSLDAKGTLDDRGHLAGTLKLVGAGLQATTAGGTELRVQGLSGTIEGAQVADGESAKGDLLLRGLEVLGGTGVEGPSLREEEVRARFEGRRASDGRFTLSLLDVSAGQALRLRTTTPISMLPGGAASAQLSGDVELQADLAKLAALKQLVPALASLETGALSASLRARPGPGLDLALGARLTNLALAPGDLVAHGYRDPDVTLQASAQRTPEGALTIQVHALSSAVARLKSAQPFVVRQAVDGGLSFAGPLDLHVDLAGLARAFGSLLGLLPGEALGGEVTIVGNATGDAEAGRLDAEIRGTRIALPPSWSERRAQATVGGTLVVAWTRSGLEADLTGLEGLGLSAEGKARLTKQAEGLDLESAEARFSGDLAELRGWFGPRLGLAPEASLAGRAQGTLRVTQPAGPRRIEGRVQVANLAFRATPEGALLEEPALTLEHASVLPAEAGPIRLETLKLLGNGYQLDLSGSTLGGADGAWDLRGSLQGDATQVAARLRPFLGEGMKDLEGRGALQGRFALASRGTPLLERASASADLTLGTWTFSGALLEATRLTLQRAGPGAPYDARLTSTLNGGSAVIALGVSPKGERLPWTLTTQLKGVDTSTWITSGAGFRRLAYVLPTLVPTGSKVPVLSGKLDAQVDLAAADLLGPDLAPTLAGRGTLALTQGTLTQSSLFGSMGSGGPGSGGWGEVGKALAQVAPEVGKLLASLVRAAAFQEITSSFEVGQERVHVKEAKMLAKEHRVDMSGTVTFAQQADLAVRLWLGSKAGEELQRVIPDQTIPLRVRGALDKPQVTPDLQAGDLLKGALPTPSDLLKDPKKALEDAKKLKDRWKELLPR